MENKIKAILTDETITGTEKLLKIAVIVDTTDDWLNSIAEIYGISKMVIKDMINGEKPAPAAEAKPSGIHAYIDLFCKCYEKIKGRKFTFKEKEIGGIKYLYKRLTIEEWHKVLATIYRAWHKQSKGVKDKSWEFIIENFSPSMLMSQFNKVMENMTAAETGKKQFDWENKK